MPSWQRYNEGPVTGSASEALLRDMAARINMELADMFGMIITKKDWVDWLEGYAAADGVDSFDANGMCNAFEFCDRIELRRGTISKGHTENLGGTAAAPNPQSSGAERNNQ